MIFEPETLASRRSFESHCKQRAIKEPIWIEGHPYARILGDQLVCIDLNDQDIAPWFLSDGYWESWVSVHLARLIKPGDVCLDIGANQGYYSLLMKKMGGKVTALEANKDLCVLLHSTSSVGNGYFATLNVAMAESSGQVVVLSGISGRDGSSSIVGEPSASGDRYSQRVTTLSIDDMVGPNGRVDIMKMDIEGAEHGAWLGAQRTLSENPEIKIVMEFTPGSYDDPEQFVQDILAQGFRINEINSQGNPTPVDSRLITRNIPGKGFYDLYLHR